MYHSGGSMQCLAIFPLLLLSIGASEVNSGRPPEPIAKPAPPSPKQVEASERDLKRGRRFAGEHKWGDAVRAFEAALKSVPASREALTDLGFAAFQAGDFGKAWAADQRALMLTTKPDERAVILYNQGRVSEARGDKAVAQQRYSESLALRPNTTVEARLKALGAATEVDPLDCGNAVGLPFTAPVPEEAFCARWLAALKAKGAGPSEGETVNCSLENDEKLPQGFRLAWLRSENPEEASLTVSIILVRQNGKNIRPVTLLDSYWNNGSLSNDWSIAEVKRGAAAGRPYVWIKGRSYSQDYVAYDEIDTKSVESVTLIFTDGKEPLFCFPVAINDTMMSATLNKEGVLGLRLVKGKALPRKGLLGDHQLPLR